MTIKSMVVALMLAACAGEPGEAPASETANPATASSASASAMPTRAEIEQASATANSMMDGSRSIIARAEADRAADVLDRANADNWAPVGDIAPMTTQCGPCMTDEKGCRFQFCSVYLCFPGLGCTWRSVTADCGACNSANNPNP